jgi:uncharacterized protein (TIGR03083 family)
MRMPLPITDTRHAFRPLSGEIVALLRALAPADWDRPTMARGWRVRHVAAHLVDTALRRLSFHRDQSTPPPPERAIAHDQDLVDFLNDLNATWVRAAQRLSPRVLTDCYARASTDLADFVETLSLDGPALFPVSWAGETRSALWLDIGREFTEVWHHASQIREAVGAGPFKDPRWLRAVLEIALHAVPHAYRGVPGREGAAVAIAITGRLPGTWTLHYRGGAWEIEEGQPVEPVATATISDEVAWRLFFNALSVQEAESQIRLDGDITFTRALLHARSVVVGPVRPI